jgi:antitoxin component YwqK of YwqJK toxin-antitoxin module
MHGIEILFDEHKRIRRKTPYNKGKKDGVVEVFYPNGDIMAQITYVNGIREGRAAKYTKDGTLLQEVTFNNDHLIN